MYFLLFKNSIIKLYSINPIIKSYYRKAIRPINFAKHAILITTFVSSFLLFLQPGGKEEVLYLAKSYLSSCSSLIH